MRSAELSGLEDEEAPKKNKKDKQAPPEAAPAAPSAPEGEPETVQEAAGRVRGGSRRRAVRARRTGKSA